MFDEQLNSFLTKFSQLRRAGFTAHLDLDTCAGKAWVGLRVMLGQEEHQNVSSFKRRSPSYFRRQERRKAARAAAAEQPILVGGESAEEATSSNKDADNDNDAATAEKVTENPSEIVQNCTKKF